MSAKISALNRLGMMLNASMIQQSQNKCLLVELKGAASRISSQITSAEQAAVFIIYKQQHCGGNYALITN